MANYSPKNVIVIFKGITLTEFDEDDFVETKRNEDGISLTVGADGAAVFNENMNFSGMVTIKLLNSSPSNPLLSALVKARERFPGTQPDKGELMIKDLGGTMLVHSAEARILKTPDLKRGKTIGALQWEFVCAKLDSEPGAQA